MKRVLWILGAVALFAGCATGTTSSTAVTLSATPATAAPPGAPAGTAAPTAGPLASSDAIATAPPATAFKEITLTGKGKKVAKFNIPEDAAAIAVITHKGKSNFIIHSIDASGATVDHLVNVIGNYSGTVLFDAGADAHSVAFQINADGAWTITIKPVTSANAWNPATTLKGTGDNVYRLTPPSSGLVTLDLTYKGKENFIVHSISADGVEHLANEIGNFSGQVLLPDRSVLLEIDADSGTWTVTPG